MGVSGPKKWPNMKFTGAISLLLVVVSIFFYFRPYLEEDFQFDEHIFQRGGSTTNQTTIRPMSGSMGRYLQLVATPTLQLVQTEGSQRFVLAGGDQNSLHNSELRRSYSGIFWLPCFFSEKSIATDVVDDFVCLVGHDEKQD